MDTGSGPDGLQEVQFLHEGPVDLDNPHRRVVTVVHGPYTDERPVTFSAFWEGPDTRHLAVIYHLGMGGGCPTVEVARVHEDSDSIIVQLVEKAGDPELACREVALPQMSVIPLRSPLGDRRVMQPVRRP